MNAILERIIALSYLDSVTGCWIWCGARVLNRDGKPYGRIKVNGKAMLAHRAAWEAVHGRKMPKRRSGAHKCDVTLCVNPDHIRAATQSSNIREAIRKGRYKPLANLNAHITRPISQRVL